MRFEVSFYFKHFKVTRQLMRAVFIYSRIVNTEGILGDIAYEFDFNKIILHLSCENVTVQSLKRLHRALS